MTINSNFGQPDPADSAEQRARGDALRQVDPNELGRYEVEPPENVGPKVLVLGHPLRDRKEIEEKLDQHKENVYLWASGVLAPTEPDEENRRVIVAELRAAIMTLEWVLDPRLA